MLSLIVAMANGNVIGKDNKIPWHLPNDLKYFKEKTTGHTIIMGRKTFESLGRVLPNRKHVVLSRNRLTLPKEVELVHDIKDVLQIVKERKDKGEEVFVIGGGNLYEQMLPYADRIYVTKIHADFSGDVYFPEIREDEWKRVHCEKGIKDEKNPYDYFFLIYERNVTTKDTTKQ